MAQKVPAPLGDTAPSKISKQFSPRKNNTLKFSSPSLISGGSYPVMLMLFVQICV